MAELSLDGKALGNPAGGNLLRKLVSQTQLLASLHWLHKSQVLACIPPNEAVPFQNVAEMACVSVSELGCVIRFTATSGFLCEPQTDHVSHTDLSLDFLLKGALSDALLFFGDTMFTPAVNAQLDRQLQAAIPYRAANGLPVITPTFSTGTHRVPRQLDGHHQPKFRRQATAFQRHVLQQAISSESATADLLEQWIADASSENSTIVQVCCDFDTVAWEIARRHPLLHFVNRQTAATELNYEGTDDGIILSNVTAQNGTPSNPGHSDTDACLYIVHLPTPSILNTLANTVSYITRILWDHFGMLRQSKSSRLIIVANGLVGSKANTKAESDARMYDLLLRKMTTDNHAITMDQMEKLLNSIHDQRWRFVIRAKKMSDIHPTIAFEVGLAAV